MSQLAMVSFISWSYVFCFLMCLSRHLECDLKFVPQNFVIFVYQVQFGGVYSMGQVLLLGINPVINHGTLNVHECSKHLIKGFCH